MSGLRLLYALPESIPLCVSAPGTFHCRGVSSCQYLARQVLSFVQGMAFVVDHGAFTSFSLCSGVRGFQRRLVRGAVCVGAQGFLQWSTLPSNTDDCW